MGYTTDFSGSFRVDKPISDELVTYINRFSSIRHMKRDVEKIKENYPNWKELCYKGELGTQGEYFVVNSNIVRQQNTVDIISYNDPADTQPGLWCQWIISEDDHASIEWDGGEKFYDYEEWLKYLIDNFLAPEGYIVNGEVGFQGEDIDDFGMIVVKDNFVNVIYGERYIDGENGLSRYEDEELIEECKKRGLV